MQEEEDRGGAPAALALTLTDRGAAGPKIESEESALTRRCHCDLARGTVTAWPKPVGVRGTP